MSNLRGRVTRLEAKEPSRLLSAFDLILLGVPVPEGFDPDRDLDQRNKGLWFDAVAAGWVPKAKGAET